MVVFRQNTEGGVVSRTVIIALQESKFFTESLTIKYTSFMPKLVQSNAVLRSQILSNPQSSVELSLTSLAVSVALPAVSRKSVTGLQRAVGLAASVQVEGIWAESVRGEKANVKRKRKAFLKK